MTDSPHAPTNDASWLSAAWRACLDVAIALAIGLVLNGIGVAVVPQLERGDHGATQESMRLFEWELKSSSASDPRALDLAAEFRALHPQATVLLETREGVVWLISNADRKGPAGEDPLVESGLWTSRVNIPSALDSVIADPGSIPLRSPLLAAWFVASTALGFLIAGHVLGRKRFPDARPPPTMTLGRRVVLGLAVGAATFVATQALAAVLEWIGFGITEQGWVRPLAEARGAPFYVLVLSVVALAPLGEEVFFRRLVFWSIRERAGRGLAYGLSAWFFAVVHLNPSAVPAYLLYGVALAWAYERTRSVVAPIVAHTVVNASALVVLLLQ